MRGKELSDYLDKDQLAVLSRLDSPEKIQAFLDSIPYSTENANRSPIRVLRERVAHCLDGGLFAAAALRRIGYPPRVIDLFPEPGRDDDHVLAIYKREGHFGSVAKSNFVGLRYREAIYRSIRELVMSYFEAYFDFDAEKTLRWYTRPLDLRTMDKAGWMWSDAGVNTVEKRLLELRRIPLLTEQMVANLSQVDQRSYEAGMLGVDVAGLYKPESKTGESGKTGAVHSG